MPVPTVPPHRLVGDIGLIDDHNAMVDVANDAQTRLAAHDTAIAAGATSASVTAEATARASAVTAEATARIAAVAAKADGLTGIVSSHALSNGSDMAPTINAELAALPSGGGVLKLPAGILTINTPLSVPASMTLQGSAGTVINNTVATTSAVILGAGSSLIGGTIMSPATFDGTTGGTWTYAVVYITGAGATVSGVTFINVPHIGIGIKDTDDAVITNCRIFGNYPSGSYTGVETAHFAINLDPGTSTTGGNLVIGQNIIKTCVQGTFIGNHGAGGVGRGVAITGNTYESCWNHGVYADQGEGYVISTNNFNRCQNPVVVSGTYHSVVGNTMTTANTGTGIDCPNISVRDAIGCVVVGNTIQGEGLASGTTIDCRELVGVELRDNIIANNIVDITGSTGVTAIRCGAGHATIMQNNSIIGNHVRGIGVSHVGLLGLYADATILGQGNKVIDNTVVVTGPAYGITLSQQTHADVRGNHMRLEYNAISTDTLGGVILTGNSVKNRIVQNDFIVGPTFGTNITYRAIWEVASSGTGNNRIGPNDYDLDPTLLTLGVPMLLISGSGTIINESGTGAPTVGASVSSMWRRTDGGPGTTLYVKESGTGTSGWVAKSGVLNAADYGAVGDGSTDDTAAIQAAITAAGAGGMVLLSALTYKHTATIDLTNGAILAGQGARTSLSYTGSGTAITQATAGTRIYNVGIRDLALSTSTGAIGIDLADVSSGEFHNVSVNGFSSKGWRIRGAVAGNSVYNTFYNCSALSCGTGWSIEASGSNSNRFHACRAGACTTGVSITDSNQNVWVDGQIEVCGTGWSITATGASKADGNVVAFTRFEGNTIDWNITSSNVRDAVILLPLSVDGAGTGLDSGTSTQIIDNRNQFLNQVRVSKSTGSWRFVRTSNALSSEPGMYVADLASGAGTPVTIQAETARSGGSFFRGIRAGTTYFDATADGSLTLAGNLTVTGTGSVGGVSIPKVTDVQTFSTAGTYTWTKPSGAVMARAEVIGGGSGGGSGRRGAAGVVRCGGGGGGGAGRADAIINASDLASTVTVVVGAGGAGGVAQTADLTDGNSGSTGGDSRFGDTSGIQIYGRVGIPGVGGTASTGTAGGVSIGMFPGAAGGAASTTGLVGNAGGFTGTSGGGGGGGGITSGNVASDGGTGSASNFSNSRTPTVAGSASGSLNGAAGAGAPVAGMGGCGGGGGAASITGDAGTGGAGGSPGAGGGGGGASLNGNNSGAGGAGGSGFVRITTYF